MNQNCTTDVGWPGDGASLPPARLQCRSCRGASWQVGVLKTSGRRGGAWRPGFQRAARCTAYAADLERQEAPGRLGHVRKLPEGASRPGPCGWGSRLCAADAGGLDVALWGVGLGDFGVDVRFDLDVRLGRITRAERRCLCQSLHACCRQSHRLC